MSVPYSNYEVWVERLRAWRLDSSVSLADLPSLHVDDNPPEVFARLISHIEEAILMVTETWSRRLQQLVERARTDFELAQALVESRRFLRRRLDLAQHQGLPDELRDALTQAYARDVRRMQQELEKSFRDARIASPAQALYWDRRLDVLVKNPITAILNKPEPVPPSNPITTPLAASRWSHRRLSS